MPRGTAAGVRTPQARCGSRWPAADTVVGVSNGERLYALAPNPDELWIVDGADHGDLWDAGIWTEAEAFFGRAMAD